MTTLLHISASPRGAESESGALARTFLETLAEHGPEVAVSHWDLWDGTLPPFGTAYAAAKMAVFGGQELTGEPAAAWEAVHATFERLAAPDVLLFSVPMWNHGVPYVLKQLIDVVSQPGLVFDFDPVAGYTGLLTGRKVVVLYTSAIYGDGRAPAFGEDFQQPYLESWLRWVGITDISSAQFRPNIATADAETGRQAAHAAARALAKAL